MRINLTTTGLQASALFPSVHKLYIINEFKIEFLSQIRLEMKKVDFLVSFTFFYIICSWMKGVKVTQILTKICRKPQVWLFCVFSEHFKFSKNNKLKNCEVSQKIYSFPHFIPYLKMTFKMFFVSNYAKKGRKAIFSLFVSALFALGWEW